VKLSYLLSGLHGQWELCPKDWLAALAVSDSSVGHYMARVAFNLLALLERPLNIYGIFPDPSAQISESLMIYPITSTLFHGSGT
jgi:hypothetical protein